MNQQRLLDRFLRYVAIDTTADESTTTYPSSDGQWELGRLLVKELHGMGVTDAVQTDHAIILATVPATNNQDGPVIALNAHLDTSPETTGANVRPNVISAYSGGDIALPGDSGKVIRVSENPELEELLGCTLITTDGTTLLGSDDKAGVAIIMETVAELMENQQVEHGPVRILFTCDEEIGRGTDHVDLDKVGAVVCYTLDGGGANAIDVETFSADLATVRVQGVNIHPSIAKDRMVNALRAAGEFLARLPRKSLAPETSSGREGFLHPYVIQGSVAEVNIRVLIRDFDSDMLEQHAQTLSQTARSVEEDIPGCQVQVAVQPQYRNMADGLQHEPRAVTLAQEAHERLGRSAELTVIRGGTDGSMFTAKGLPTPNLSSGQHTPHSPLEWACLDEMTQATEVLLELVQVWASKGQ